MSGAQRLEAVVRGRVQGVGFRLFVLRAARALRLEGWVRNEPGGVVRAVAEGARADLDRLLATLREGPPGARVDRVDEQWSEALGDLGTFDVRSGWHSGD